MNEHARLVAILIKGMPCQHDHGGQSSHQICQRATRMAAEALATQLLAIDDFGEPNPDREEMS